MTAPPRPRRATSVGRRSAPAARGSAKARPTSKPRPTSKAPEPSLLHTAGATTAADTVFLAVVRGVQTFGDHEECIRRLMSRYGDLNWGSIVGSQLVQQRNDAVRGFLATGCEWLFFLDSDMTFAPDALDELLAVADAETHPVVGGVTVSFDPRSRVVRPTMYVLADDGVTLRPVAAWTPGKVVRVSATGAACLLIHRSVLETVAAAGFSVEFPWFDLGRDGRPNGTGEDIEFCRRLRALDIPIHVHTGVPFGHLKVIELSVADFVNQLDSQEP